ncbi:MAG: glucose-1-phosphate adenylyltransferase [Sporomusaceae bacterium]|nr:glucose-1-phosphate adenylyltransferase [Sporomusaceae bacterium]
MKAKECIAMILAGGQGSRLGSLTKKLAKPAVPFGGKYRIIDFPLSNCHNSGIDTVGVLTQYRPLALHNYIGIGSAWDLDRQNGGVYVLPPYASEEGGEWYKGTADAIYQNINFIELFGAEYVLVLSGDHIYKMDYSKMLDFHRQKKADATIAVFEVPWEEAPRFGIMNTADNGRIEEFEEKPKHPKNNLASMGVYIFTVKPLLKALQEDAKDAKSSHDFGKNVIPKLLKEKHKLFAYKFSGYWKDVGTVDSFWEANMDLLSGDSQLDLYDRNWRIYSVNPTRPPHYIAPTAKVKDALISEGSQIFGEVEHSVIFPGVVVGEGAKIIDSVIMPYAVIEPGAVVTKAIVCRKATIEEGCQVGDTEVENDKRNVTVVVENARVRDKKGAGKNKQVG